MCDDCTEMQESKSYHSHFPDMTLILAVFVFPANFSLFFSQILRFC